MRPFRAPSTPEHEKAACSGDPDSAGIGTPGSLAAQKMLARGDNQTDPLPLFHLLAQEKSRAHWRRDSARGTLQTQHWESARSKVQEATCLGTSRIGFEAVSSRMDFNIGSGPSPLRTKAFSLAMHSSGTSTPDTMRIGTLGLCAFIASATNRS